jgi:hypothetical protein
MAIFSLKSFANFENLINNPNPKEITPRIHLAQPKIRGN